MFPDLNSNADFNRILSCHYENAGNRRTQLLWFDLGERDPYFILPILAGVFTFIQQKLMMAGTAQQNPQMAMMLWLMPIMIVVFAISFPAALSLYWVVGNLFMIAQTFFIKGPDLKAERQEAAAGGKNPEVRKVKELTATGRTVDEAVQSGLEQLGLHADDVEVDVVDEGKRDYSAFSVIGLQS